VVEEVEAQPGEYPPFVGYQLGEDDVECGDPIGGHEKEVGVIDLEDLPDLPRGDVW